MLNLRVMVASMLLCVGVTITSCGSGGEVSPDGSSYTEMIAGQPVQYFVYDKRLPDGYFISGNAAGEGRPKPEMRPYMYTYLSVERYDDRDAVGIQVSDVCSSNSREEAKATAPRLVCDYRGPEISDTITPEQAAAVLSPEAVARLTQIARDAKRDLMFTLVCTTPMTYQFGGNTYNGPPGCPA